MVCLTKKVPEVLIFPISWQIIRVQDHDLVSSRNCRQNWSWIIGVSVCWDLPEDFCPVVGQSVLHSRWHCCKDFCDEALVFKLAVKLHPEDFISHLSYIMLPDIYSKNFTWTHQGVLVGSSSFLASF